MSYTIKILFENIIEQKLIYNIFGVWPPMGLWESEFVKMLSFANGFQTMA